MSSADRRAVHEAGHAAACLTYGAPIVSISSASGRAYLHRGRWQPPAAIAVEAMATVCLAGAAAEAMICGGDDLGDAIDIEMAMACLRSAYSGLDLQRQFARAQAAAGAHSFGTATDSDYRRRAQAAEHDRRR